MVKNGAELVVGYLKVKTELSALAKKGRGTSTTAAAVTAVEEKKPAETRNFEKPPVVSDDKKAVKQKNRKDAEKKN